MLILLGIALLLAVLYVLLMLAYSRGWKQQEVFTAPPQFGPQTRISVVIPARNEADNIGSCLQSVLANDYPAELMEVIVVDDFSTDATRDRAIEAGGSRVRVLSLRELLGDAQLNSYKKKALETGIANASGELIVTTDADCTVNRGWLKHMAAMYETRQPVMIAGPVVFSTAPGLAATFQVLDFMAMQGITAAAHQLNLGNMSNGANLAFSKAAFEQVGGYRGIDHLASGDDFLLMMKLKKAWPDRISYLKSAEAMVTTPPQPSWGSFLQQRIRWASKSGKYDDRELTSILGLVYLFNLSILALCIAAFAEPLFWLLAAGILLLKTVAELYFLIPVAGFFGRSRQLRWFIFFQPLHTLYIVIAGLLGFVGVYRWKGRRVR